MKLATSILLGEQKSLIFFLFYGWLLSGIGQAMEAPALKPFSIFRRKHLEEEVPISPSEERIHESKTLLESGCQTEQEEEVRQLKQDLEIARRECETLKETVGILLRLRS